jgi:hypothetical protein
MRDIAHSSMTRQIYKPIHRIAISMGISIAISAAALLASTGSAHAAGNPYAGKDPTRPFNGVVCANGAYAVNNTALHGSASGGPTLHLMYSPTCNTNWAEVDGYVEPVDIIVWNVSSNESDHINQSYADYSIANYGGYGYTSMVDGTRDAGACEDTDHSYYCRVQADAANAIPSPAYWLS